MGCLFVPGIGTDHDNRLFPGSRGNENPESESAGRTGGIPVKPVRHGLPIQLGRFPAGYSDRPRRITRPLCQTNCIHRSVLLLGQRRVPTGCRWFLRRSRGNRRAIPWKPESNGPLPPDQGRHCRQPGYPTNAPGKTARRFRLESRRFECARAVFCPHSGRQDWRSKRRHVYRRSGRDSIDPAGRSNDIHSNFPWVGGTRDTGSVSARK